MRKFTILFIAVVLLVILAVFGYLIWRNAGLKDILGGVRKEKVLTEKSLNTLPADFPKSFPLYKNTQLIGAIRLTEDGVVYFEIEYETSDEKAKVVEFFKRELTRDGFKIALTSNTKDETVFYLSQNNEDAGMVTILAQEELTVISIKIKEYVE